MEAVMTALDTLIATPRLVEIDRVDLAAPPDRVWQRIRHGALAHAPATRALFALRTMIDRINGADTRPPRDIRLEDLRSSDERPGFQILVDEPPREVAVGAIGQVWRLRIPFRHVLGAAPFATFSEPGFAKVAWAIRVSPFGAGGSHLEVEVRVTTTDDVSWRRFRRYFRVIGPASRFIRRSLLGALRRELGALPVDDERRSLPGDGLLADASTQMSHRIDIAATPDAIWPWLVQMGGGRAGFYSIDMLDNDRTRSAREIHPELQHLTVGDVIPATPRAAEGFEVLEVEPHRALVLGGLFDREGRQSLAFADPRPQHFWHVTWAFLLEPLDRRSTRLTVRVRGAYARSERGRARWMRVVHPLMQTTQLRQLARRAEGRLRRDDWRDVAEGIGGAARIAFALLTPWRRDSRGHWGGDATAATRRLPGDELVDAPLWCWTHSVDVDAPAEAVWPWVAQIGANRGGFYSYQWLENLVGCRVRNAETVHPDWAVRAGDGLVLHPAVPPLSIAALEPGRFFVAHAPAEPRAMAVGGPWVSASWLLLVEPQGPARSRFVSRYRAASSSDLRTRLAFGPTVVEPIGTEMDRRMLLGVKARAEQTRRTAVV
jgi:hypothetical protein